MKIPFEYVTGYYDGDYSIEGSITNGEKEILKHILYELNACSLGCCTMTNYKKVLNDRNISFLLFEDKAVLFKTYGNYCNNFVVNELEGLVVEKKYVFSLWFLMEKIIYFLYSDMFYDKQGSQIIFEEELENIRDVSFLNGEFIQDYKELFNYISVESFPKSFVLSCSNPDFNNVKFFPNKFYEHMWGEADIRNLSNALRIEHIKNVNTLKSGKIRFVEKGVFDKFKGKKESMLYGWIIDSQGKSECVNYLFTDNHASFEDLKIKAKEF